MRHYDHESINMCDVILGRQNAVDPDLLVPPSKRDFGTEPDIRDKHVRLRIGNRPLARNLRVLYKLSNRKLPEDLEVFMSYDIWLLTHAVSVIQEDGFKKIQQVGYQMCFPDDPKVTVIEMLPQTRFIRKIGTSLESETDIKISGQASVPDSLTQLLDHVDGLSFGGKLTVCNHANIAIRLSFAVMSPVVLAVGVGDSNSEWVFTRQQQPLLGDQLMIQLVLTPKYLEKLNFRARVYATISTFNFLPVRLKSNWIELECELK